MKKLICVILALVMVLALCACSVNKTEVSVLWAGAEDHATQPNSLINAMDRAMYIEKIDYQHYAAAGDQAAQTAQAESCLANGCSALLVELVDASAAQTIVDLAKAKDVPVVFFGTAVDAAVVSSYAKCAAVATDSASVLTAFSKMVSEYVVDNRATLDADGDGNIHYICVGNNPCTVGSLTVETKEGQITLNLVQQDAALEDLELQVQTIEGKKMFVFKTVEEKRQLATADGTIIDMILCEDDEKALETLVALQAMDINTDKLSTCFVPLFAIGADADYKAYVMADMPTDEEGRKAHLAEMAMLADMTVLDAAEWEKWTAGEENEVDSMIFNTMNQIDTGRLTGTVMENDDAIAEAAAKLAAQLLKGEAPAESYVRVDYTIYN